MEILMIMNHAITAILLMMVIYIMCVDEPKENKYKNKDKEDPLKKLKKGNAIWYRNGKWYEEKNGNLELYYDENA
jgi:hypothetical protein